MKNNNLRESSNSIIVARLLTFLLVVAILASFTSCKAEDKSPLKNGTNNSQSTIKDEEDNTTPTDEPNNSQVDIRTKIDPFVGIECMVTGISPYCKILVNNQNCDITAQKYVTYSFDSEKYANGDTAIITATLDLEAQEQYLLSKTTYEYIVQNQPEYITSTSNLDFSFLESELQDYMNAECSAALGTEFAFGENLYAWSFDDRIVANISFSIQEKYFSSLKLMRMDLMNSETPFNKLSFVYKINITASDNSSETLYINISALNIVKNPDSSLKWGTISANDFDFARVTYRSSLEECVANTIIANKTNYNIIKID